MQIGMITDNNFLTALKGKSLKKIMTFTVTLFDMRFAIEGFC